MLDYLARRMAVSALVLLLVSMTVFAGLRFLPGDPARVLAGTEADDAGMQEIRERYGLDRPVPVQYASWLGQVLRGRLGESIRTRDPVLRTVAYKLPITFQLAGLALLVAAGIGIPMGVLSAVRRNSVWDWLANALSLTGTSIPNFWFGILLILLFGLTLHLFPVAGFGETVPQHIWYLFLPALTLALQLSAVLIRNLRGQIILTLRSDYVRTARAKGLSETLVLMRHVLRNALLSTVTILGLQFGYLVGGTIVVETVFALPGTGQLLIQSITARDYPVVQAITVVSAVLVIVVNLAVDLSYSFLDPRVTYE
jgi:peptide/nickel transport system permease protein